MESLKTAAESNENRLESKVTDLETKLENLQTFADTKQRMETDIVSLSGSLEQERTAFRSNIDTIENKFLLEREKIKKGYDQKYQKMKKEEASKLDVLLSKKTKNISISNVMMKKELDDQSRHAEKLLEINKAMSDRDRELRIENQLSTSMISKLELDLATAQRLVRQQNENIKHLDAKLLATEAINQQREEALQDEIQTTKSMVLTLQQKPTSKPDRKREELLRYMIKYLEENTHLEKRKKFFIQSTSSSASNSLISPSDQEEIIIKLVHTLISKFPKRFKFLQQSSASRSIAVSSKQNELSSSSETKHVGNEELDQLATQSFLDTSSMISQRTKFPTESTLKSKSSPWDTKW